MSFWGTLNRVLHREAPIRGPTPCPFMYHFLTEKVSLLCSFYWQMVPLSHTYKRTLYTFNCFDLPIFLISIEQKAKTASFLCHFHDAKLRIFENVWNKSLLRIPKWHWVLFSFSHQVVKFPILYLQAEKVTPSGEESLPVKANMGIGLCWVISSLCNSLEPGSSVGKKSKKRDGTAKKSGWLGIFFAFSPPLRSLVSGYINVMSLLILQLESTLSRIPTQKMTKRSKEDKVLWTCFVFLRGLFTRGFRIKFAHAYAMKESAKIFISTDLGHFCVLFLFCLFVWNRGTISLLHSRF